MTVLPYEIRPTQRSFLQRAKLYNIPQTLFYSTAAREGWWPSIAQLLLEPRSIYDFSDKNYIHEHTPALSLSNTHNHGTDNFGQQTLGLVLVTAKWTRQWGKKKKCPAVILLGKGCVTMLSRRTACQGHQRKRMNPCRRWWTNSREVRETGG